MLFYVGLPIVVFFLLFYLISKNNRVRSPEVGMVLIIPFALSVFGMILAMIGRSTLDIEYYKKNTKQIYALNDATGVKGEFFLGSGTIEGTNYYLMYVPSQYGGKEFEKVPAHESVIRKSDDPRIVYRGFEHASSLSWLISFPPQKRHTEEPLYFIYVPEGTIKQNINIDLKG